MRNLFFLSLFSGLMFTSCGTRQVVENPPITIVWEMGRNGITPGAFESTFHITNNTNEPLGSNFIIYYNMLSAFPLNPNVESASLRIEQVVASFHKMVPTENWQPLMPGETYSFTTHHRGRIQRESWSPQGGYIVMLDENGNELAPQTIAILVEPFDRKYQWTPVGFTFPYSDGEFVFAENAFFHTVDLCITDIFPAPKSIEKQGGTSTFGRNVHLTFDPSFENEANLLRHRMSHLFGTRFTSGGTLVELVLLCEDKKTPSPEYYEMTVKDGRVVLAAQTAHGMFNATRTLINILGNVPSFPAEIPNMHIADFPDFYHRGFMLDVSRNFTRKENVLKIIEHIANYKLNVLHLHLTDDEGWRIEIPGLPELTEVGGRRGHTLTELDHLKSLYDWGWNPDCPESLASGYFSRQDFIDILRFAAERHIRVIPEINVPGHARAAVISMNARYHRWKDIDYDKATEFLLWDPNDECVAISVQHYRRNSVNAAMPSTYRFFEHVINEIYKMYQDAGLQLELLHVGGDEVPRGVWENSPIARAFMAEHGMTQMRDLKDYFVLRLLDILDARGIQAAGWEEVVMLTEGRDAKINERFVGRDVLTFAWNTVHDWGGDQLPYRLANAGYPVILANVANFYMDLSYMHHPQEPGLSWGGFVNEFNSFDMLPFQIYKSLHRDLRGNPIDIHAHTARSTPLNPEARHLIKGLQAQLWAETIRSFDMVEYYIFPKMFGLFDRAWNAEPEWSTPFDADKHIAARNRYANQLANLELPRLQRMGANFRIAPPGIILRDGMLHANSIIPKGVIRFTTDGSQPTANSPIWTAPVAVPADWTRIRAAVFYLGKQSTTISLRREDVNEEKI